MSQTSSNNEERKKLEDKHLVKLSGFEPFQKIVNNIHTFLLEFAHLLIAHMFKIALIK